MNCKMLFLKRARLSELLIILSKLFHSITEDGKNEFLKKIMFDIEPRNVADIICITYCFSVCITYCFNFLMWLVYSIRKNATTT